MGAWRRAAGVVVHEEPIVVCSPGLDVSIQVPLLPASKHHGSVVECARDAVPSADQQHKGCFSGAVPGKLDAILLAFAEQAEAPQTRDFRGRHAGRSPGKPFRKRSVPIPHAALEALGVDELCRARLDEHCLAVLGAFGAAVGFPHDAHSPALLPSLWVLPPQLDALRSRLR